MSSIDLIKRISPQVFAENGLTYETIAKLEIDELLVEQILDCLRSCNVEDLRVGLRFAECLVSRRNFCQSAGPKLGTIAALVRKDLAESDGALKQVALGAFIGFREFYPDYPDQMVSFFLCPDLNVRYEALSRADTYMSGQYVRYLRTFKDDPTMCQGTGKLGNDTAFIFRDLALKTAEKFAARSFECGRLYEVHEGTKVWWRSWKKFDNWLDRIAWRHSLT